MGKLYWLGNSAKARIISEILGQVSTEDALIFDYGCGDGGDWPAVLSDHPCLRLIGYDPARRQIEIARARLKGLDADLFTGDELLYQFNFKARFIVSFSVFEHVYDRRSYLQTARKHLAENGVFYLNYDDGHFRNFLDLNAPRLWPGQCREWAHNLLAAPMARAGRRSRFRKRVDRTALDKLLLETGFRVEDVFYSNLASLKGLSKTIPGESREDFMRLWLGLEDELNTRFLENGDAANLWQCMPSRTLVLRPQL